MTNGILKEKLELEALAKELAARQASAPEGHLRVSNNGGRVQYYCVQEPGDTHGKYIRKKDRSLAAALAQKDYEKQVLAEVGRKLAHIDHYLRNDSDFSADKCYDELNIYRKELVQPVVDSADEFVNRWLSEPYEGRGFEEHDPIFHTKRGDRVRSKSEVLIANMFYDFGIPYLYERPVSINGRNVYADFTLLKTETREPIYWEHFGMMGNPSYTNDALWKLDNYARNGIILGKNLLVSFESAERPLDLRVVEIMIRENFFADK